MNADAVSPDSLLQHASWLRALARQLAHDESTAEDLVQDTFATALTAVPRPSDLRTWLARAIERHARHRRRSDHRRRYREGVAAARQSDRSDADVHDAFEAQRALARLVQELPEPYRTLIMRRYYDGWSAAEIARRTGVAAGTVRSQLARARAMLRQRWNTRSATAEHRGFAGLALIAGIAPDALRGGIFMKSSHAGLLTAVSALVLGLIWSSGVLTPNANRPDADDEQVAELVPLDSFDEGTDVEDVAIDSTAERTALQPALPDEPAEATPETRLIARIVDVDGHAVAGARLDAPEWKGFGSAESDSAGQLVLVTEREKIQIWEGRVVPRLFRLAAEGHETRFLRAAMERDADTDLGDVVMRPGGNVSGRVVDETGAPIAGARVIVSDAAIGADADNARRNGPRGDGERVEEVTASDGTYRVAGVAAGAGRVWARIEGRPWAFTPAVDVLPASEVRAPDLVLVAPDPETLIAGVVLGPTGDPVAGAVVVATGLAAGPIRHERSTADEDGRFAVMAFDQGPHNVGAFDPEAALSPTYRSRVLPGTDDLELRLEELRRIEIEVVDDRDGTPVAEPWIHVDEQGAMPHASGAPRAKHEDLGAGRLSVALPTREFSINASAPGYGYQSFGPFVPDALPAVFEIRLEKKPMVSGRVLANGEPVAGARVQTMRDITAVFSIMTEGFQTRLFSGGAFSTETDEDGRFEHPVSLSMPRGAHVVHASKDGWAAAELVVEVDDDGAHGVELVLTPGGAIEGRLLLPAGTEPRGAIVAASNGDGSVRTTRADETGFYRLEHLAPGPWEVQYREEQERYFMTQSANPPGEPYQGDCVVVEGETTRLDLDERANLVTIEGRLAIDGVPAAGWTARLEDTESVFTSDIPGSDVLDASGTFALDHDGGSARLVLETPETSTEFVRLSRDLPEGGADVNASLDIETGELSGTAPSRARLRLTTKIGESWRHEFIIEAELDGSFRASTPAGRVTIAIETVEPEKFTRWVDVATKDVAAGGVTTVSLGD